MKEFVLFCALLIGCSSCVKNKSKRTDTTTSGLAEFVSDDCFAPIVQEEVDVFEALNEKASLFPTYTNEVNAVHLLLKDSVRTAVLARDLTDAEKQGLTEKNLLPRSQKVATDGIALIIHKENSDSLISTAALKKIMTGEVTSWKELNPLSPLDQIQVVFDNPNSSTVRFIKDSICRGQPLSDRLRTQDTNQEVVDYVARTPHAMGVVGVNWVINPGDTTNQSFKEDIRVMWVSREEVPALSNSYQPMAYSLALKEYPLTRDVYIIISDYRGTLLSGFVNFMVGDRGQRIILRSGLLPATRTVRLITVRDHF